MARSDRDSLVHPRRRFSLAPDVVSPAGDGAVDCECTTAERPDGDSLIGTAGNLDPGAVDGLPTDEAAVDGCSTSMVPTRRHRPVGTAGDVSEP